MNASDLLLSTLAFLGAATITLLLLQPWRAPPTPPTDYTNPGTILQQQGSGK